MGHEMRIERELSLDFLRVCEAAAIASARTMGQGDRKYSDHVAVEAMREVMDTVPMRGRVVIGEGERDEAPMLYIGEEVGGVSRSAKKSAASTRRLTLQLIHWKRQICARWEPKMPSQCWRRLSAAGCSMRRTSTWIKSSLAHHVAAQLILMRPSKTT